MGPYGCDADALELLDAVDEVALDHGRVGREGEYAVSVLPFVELERALVIEDMEERWRARLMSSAGRTGQLLERVGSDRGGPRPVSQRLWPDCALPWGGYRDEEWEEDW